ncbi:MAG: hypothetical protein U1F83_16830 [Verrucomicrobiota bacterium]
MLENYRTARLELDELNQLFAPLQKTVEGLKSDLRPQGHPPAQIVEQASVPTTADTREAGRGRVILGGGGLAFVLGFGLLWFSRKPKTSTK